MYVLVKDNKVFAGPNDWNISLFQAYIEQDFGLTVTLPTTAPASGTDLGNGIIAYDVVKVVPSLNSKIQRLDGPFYTFTDIATQTYTVVDKPLPQIKNELTTTIAANRYETEIGGVQVTIQGHSIIINTDRINRNIYLQALQNNKDGVAWKLTEITQVVTPPVRPTPPEGAPPVIRPNRSSQPRLVTSTIWLNLSLAELQTVVTAVADFIQTVFTWEQTTDTVINACTDTAALNAIVLTYPPVTYTATGT
jgi:hypothetical protein